MKRIIKTLLLSLCFVFMTTPLMAAMPFWDVKTSDWFYDEVQYVYDRDLFGGTSATTFEPQTKMTRAMFVTVLGRMSGVDPSLYNDVYFSDVVPGSWYAPYVQWAYEEGITDGISATEFGVNRPVTREQMAKFIIVYSWKQNIDFVRVSPGYSFDDFDEISDWSYYYVYECQEYGLLTGRDDNSFDPRAGSTRAEVATLIQRVCKAADGERIITNYPYSNIPTYDSVTLDFCEMSGYFYGEYFETAYFAGADLMVYPYNKSNVDMYRSYLVSNGFRLERQEAADDGVVYLYSRNGEHVLVSEPLISGTRYVAIYIDLYSDDL